jgi:hypothetical protein
MKKFFNKIGNVVKKGNAMINIPLIKDEKRTLEQQLEELREEYENKKKLRDETGIIIRELNLLIRNNTRQMENLNTKEFSNKRSIIMIIERAIDDLNNEKQRIKESSDFNENNYVENIKNLENRISKLGNDLTKFREIVKK